MSSGHPSLHWECSRCRPGWTPGPLDPPEHELRMDRGCDRPNPALDLPGGLTRCPQTVLTPAVMTWISAFAWYRQFGELPFRGGWDEQPAIVGAAFRELALAQAEDQRERLSVAQAQQRAALRETSWRSRTS